MPESLPNPPESVDFLASGNRLVGRLIVPAGEGPYPAVVFVAGSGPSRWDGGGGNIPLFEAFISRGIACLAWNKPGVGESTGNWKFQTFDDRADEVLGSIEFLKSRDDIDSSRIGMWGVSQAGWVMPKVCARSSGIAFVIAVGVPVGTIAEQNVFRVGSTMPADGYSEEETAGALELVRLIQEYVERGAPLAEVAELYGRYEGERWVELAVGRPDPGMYEFFKGIVATDLAPDVAAFRCPVLAVFGERDRIVDVVEGSEHYSRVLAASGNTDVTVRVIPGANHNIRLAETGGQEEVERMTESGSWQYAPEYLELIGAWAAERMK